MFNHFTLFKKMAAFSCFLSLVLGFSRSVEANWEPAVAVSQPGVNVKAFSGPYLTVNTLGEAVAVWHVGVTSDSHVWSANFDPLNGWQPPVEISSLAKIPNGNFIYTGQGDAQAAINNLGYAVAAWEGEELVGANSVSEIITNIRDPNGNWSSAVQPASTVNVTDSSFDAENPFVAINDAGKVLISWIQTETDNFNRYVMANTMKIGSGGWGTPVYLTDIILIDSEYTPDVALNEKGDGVVIWRYFTSPGLKGVAVSLLDGSSGTWTGPTVLESGQIAVSQPKTAIDPSGNAVAVWSRYSGSSVTDIMASYYTFGVGWSTPIVIGVGGGSSNQDPSVVMDSFGNATAIWTSYQGGAMYNVFAADLPLGGTWSTPVNISQVLDGEINIGLIQRPLAVNPVGDVIAIWQDYDNLSLQSSFRPFGQPWQDSELIFSYPPNTSPTEENIGLASCDLAIALWLQSYDVNVVLSSVNYFNEQVQPPANVKGCRCCDKFATQEACYNILTWNAPSDCAASFNVYEDGVLVATISAKDPLIFIGFADSRTTVYEITSVNVYGVESSPVEVTITSKNKCSKKLY